MTAKAEVAIVGGGPGGLNAALAAAQSGAQVTLIDAYPQLGGQYYRQPPDRLLNQSTKHQRQGQELIQRVVQAGVHILSGTTVWNLDSSRILACNGPEGTFLLDAQAVILATGTYERSVPFPGWTLPGVMMTGGAQGLLYQHVKPGKRALLVGTGPLQLVVAKKLLDAGVQVAAVLEGSQFLKRAFRHVGAMWGQWERLSEGMLSIATIIRHRVPYRLGWGIVAAQGTKQVESATIAQLDRHWRPIPGTEQTVACDTICMGYGLIPFNTLSRLVGAAHEWRPDLGGDVPVRTENLETSIAGIYAVCDGAGIGGAHLSSLEGRVAGFAAAAQLGYRPEQAQSEIRHLAPALTQERHFQKMYADLYTPENGIYELAQDDTPICRCEGVTRERVRETIAKGFISVPEIKNRTRCGMGECQGRMCGQYVVHYVAQETGLPVNEVGVYPARPPVFPISVEALARLENTSDKQ